MTPSQFAIRNCQSLDELRACLELQQEVWGFSDAELIPLRVFSLAPKIGGQVIGAWDGDTLAGFALSIPGVRRGHSYLHSHMLGVKQGYRDSGLGRRIKLFQREDAIAKGYGLIEWTYDPLEIKNAYLNLEKLGAVSRRYNINQYGITASVLHGGLPTDRLVAEWWLTSQRVQALLATGQRPPAAAELRVEVPAEIYAWKADPAMRAKAVEVQSHNRDQFISAFSRGLSCLGYERDTHGNGIFLLGRWGENWSYGTE